MAPQQEYLTIYERFLQYLFILKNKKTLLDILYKKDSYRQNNIVKNYGG